MIIPIATQSLWYTGHYGRCVIRLPRELRNHFDTELEPESSLIQESMSCKITVMGLHYPLILGALTRMEWGVSTGGEYRMN